MKKAFLYRIKGRVQGVGFRFFVYKKAELLGIKGYVKNLLNGDVEVWGEGNENQLKEFEKFLKKGPTFARVVEILKEEQEPDAFQIFEIKY